MIIELGSVSVETKGPAIAVTEGAGVYPGQF